jgi:O-acetyl-ADP-ribose deacetylase (regulator of RNase III)
MTLTIIRDDITTLHVEAIVNAANTDLQMGGGVCGAIFKAAGPGVMQAAADAVAPIKTGQVAITPGFDLPAKYVIHAAGPIYSHWRPEQAASYLADAYRNALELASEKGLVSIAFPLIASGVYGFPKAEAFQIATDTIRDFLTTHELEVYLVVYDKDSFAISQSLVDDVEAYIDENYVDENYVRRPHTIGDVTAMVIPEMMAEESLKSAPNLEDLIGNLDEPFGMSLMRLIDVKGMTDVEVYKRANMDRKLFSKIRTGKNYVPSKRNVLALAIGLRLNLDETDELLERAGYAISHSQKADVIVEYFILNGNYDIYEINGVLFEYDQPTLGSY